MFLVALPFYINNDYDVLKLDQEKQQSIRKRISKDNNCYILTRFSFCIFFLLFIFTRRENYLSRFGDAIAKKKNDKNSIP